MAMHDCMRPELLNAFFQLIVEVQPHRESACRNNMLRRRLPQFLKKCVFQNKEPLLAGLLQPTFRSMIAQYGAFKKNILPSGYLT